MDFPSYGPEDDCPHINAPDDPTWQESTLFAWHDAKAGVGGFLRLGHEPSNKAANICFGVYGPNGERFRWNLTGAPLAPGDRTATTMGLGEQLKVCLAGDPRIDVSFPDCEAHLVFHDFHPRFEFGVLVGAPTVYGDTAGKHHFEVAGAMRGTIRIGDKTIQIDGLAYRDRSWGVRIWSASRGTRWWPTVFGPDLSFHMIHKMTDSTGLVKHGYIVRNGAPARVVDSDMVIHLESDALTYRRAEVILRTDDGEEIRADWRLDDGIVMHVRGYTAVEGVGTARVGDRVGFSHLEVCTNPALGTAAPKFALYANVTDGLSQAEGGKPARRIGVSPTLIDA